MPIHKEKNQVNRAKNHTNWLSQKYNNVSVKVVPLTELYDTFCQLDAAPNQFEGTGLSLANTRSRLRMATLYYFASKQRLLVAGTGNKVEDFGVGFYTKYGDGGVDVSPIADLMKSQVKELASHLGVDRSIVNAAPTDGLWEIIEPMKTNLARLMTNLNGRWNNMKTAKHLLILAIAKKMCSQLI